jgi:hypothetical protein
VCLFLGFQGQVIKFPHVSFVVESFLHFPLVKIIDDASVAWLVVH